MENEKGLFGRQRKFFTGQEKKQKRNRGLRRLLALVVAVAGASVACGGSPPDNPQAAPAGAPSQQARVPGEYLITVVTPNETGAIAELYGRFGLKRVQPLGRNVFLVTLAEDPGPEAMEKLRQGSSRIKAVEPNLMYRSQ